MTSQRFGRSAGRPLRVLYFIGSYGPDVMGNASHEETVLALRARGHEVEVLTQITDAHAPRFSRVDFNGVPVWRVNLSGEGGRLQQLWRVLASRVLKYEYAPLLLGAYRRRVRAGRYNLVHVEGGYPFGLIAALGSGRTPYMANVQGADVIDLPDYDYGYRRYFAPGLGVAYALRRAAVVRVISQLLADYLQKERLGSPGRTVVILRAIEDAAFPLPGETFDGLYREGRELLASRYGIGLDRPVVMALSRLHPFKGLEYLVDALRIVAERCRAEGRDLPWLVLGGPSRSTESYGDYRAFLQKRAEAAGMASHVIFTGQVDHSQVKLHLAAASVFVCPSILEAQNKVVPEAAAVGVPSVVTETTGIATYLAPEGACVPVPPASAPALADAILGLLTNESHYEQVRRNALRMAETLRVEVVAPRVEEAWYRAAGTAKRG